VFSSLYEVPKLKSASSKQIFRNIMSPCHIDPRQYFVILYLLFQSYVQNDIVRYFEYIYSGVISAKHCGV